MGLRGMAAAPLRAPGGEVIGTLAISSATPREFEPEERDLLQGLADQAAIAITNSTLLTRLTESEERYRYLVENAPDLVWSIGADARLTFVSDAVERLTGVHPDELVGRHFGALLHESSSEVAKYDWASEMERDSQEIRGRVNLLAQDGSPIAAEFIAVARLDEAGRFAGANGYSSAIRRPGDTENRQLVHAQHAGLPGGNKFPDPHIAVLAGGRERFAVRRKAQIMDSTQVPLERMNQFAAGDVPDRHDSIGATCRQPFSVRRESQRHHFAVMDAQRGADFFACLCVPEAHLTVGVAGGRQFSVGGEGNRMQSRLMS
jgi:PAS domain S-box-containing protein